MYTNYDIAEGLRLVAALSTSQWQLGDLACKVGDLDLGEFAEKIGLEEPQLRRYRKVAEAWPHDVRVAGVPWTLHRMLTEGERAISYPTPAMRCAKLTAYAEQCAEAGAKPSVRGLQRFLGERPTPEIAASRRDEQVGQALSEMGTGDRGRVLTGLLADEDTADAALADPAVMESVLDAMRRKNERENLHRSRPGLAPEHTDTSPESHLGEMTLVTGRLMAARRALNEVAEILNASPFLHGNAAYRDAVTAMTTGLRNRLDIIEGIAGGQSFEEGLEAVLAGDDS
jgi:hypothetical protein